jgi:hypothetical protein
VLATPLAVLAVEAPRFVRRIETRETDIDVHRVPRSRAGRLPWPTGRGGLLRAGS